MLYTEKVIYNACIPLLDTLTELHKALTKLRWADFAQVSRRPLPYFNETNKHCLHQTHRRCQHAASKPHGIALHVVRNHISFNRRRLHRGTRVYV